MFVIVSIVYLVVATVIIVRVRGWVRKVLWAIAFLLIPTWDILLAEAYMRYWCWQDGGVRVYGSVMVKETELVKAKCGVKKKYERVVKELSKGKDADCLYLPERFHSVDGSRDFLPFGVVRQYDSYTDVVTGKLLGERILYGYRTGWFIQMLGYRGWDGGCRSSEEIRTYSHRKFFDSMFRIERRN